MASVEAARHAFARRAWREAFDGLTAIAQHADLEPSDRELLAVSAYLTGADSACAEAWEAAHRAALDAGDLAEAARYAFWLGLCLMLRGQVAQAGGWLARVQGLVAEGAGEPAAGYLLVPAVLGALQSGDAERARDLAIEATAAGDRGGDGDLKTFGTLGHGQALIALGDTGAGVARLDEAMVAVTTGEVGPITTGLVYCAVILECMAMLDLQRAAEWTDALAAWCDAQPDLVPYRGACLVHRSQLQQAAGEWPDAMQTVELARRRLEDPPHPALGLAHYQAGELHRLAGAFDAADAEYRQASRHGRQPVPGLALLELARGDATGAAATIRRALAEAASPSERPALLAAAVDVFRASGDRSEARAAADELAAVAAGASAAALTAFASLASGEVELDEGDPAAALAHLRAAAAGWHSLRMPYEAARTAVEIGRACALLDDRAAAGVELDNARAVFTRLGAGPDVAAVDALAADLLGRAPEDAEPALSAREREVLALVASGRTNREIASELTISQHTVGRHLENIFAKLGVASRAAATAHAYEHGLL